MSYQFTTIIQKEGNWYTALCPELGVISQGKTIEEAKKKYQRSERALFRG
ncbi:type II toxin-antitoxin system HicB family antitoxin [Candidatus Parcubacteria bacterium]|nr:type II toxin-antitoxin system HicB family antitoxin [Candidatus Parcubacteria bacterium]